MVSGSWLATLLQNPWTMARVRAAWCRTLTTGRETGAAQIGTSRSASYSARRTSCRSGRGKRIGRGTRTGFGSKLVEGWNINGIVQVSHRASVDSYAGDPACQHRHGEPSELHRESDTRQPRLRTDGSTRQPSGRRTSTLSETAAAAPSTAPARTRWM